MPLTYHRDVEVAVGVPWTINGTLCNAAGAPFDVTNAQLAPDERAGPTTFFRPAARGSACDGSASLVDSAPTV
jgi:hypothetical protein